MYSIRLNIADFFYPVCDWYEIFFIAFYTK